MLNHFRSLSLEATVLENNNHSLESEAAEARGALQSARDRLLDLERQLADKDSLIRGYETQVGHFFLVIFIFCILYRTNVQVLIGNLYFDNPSGQCYTLIQIF